MTEPKLCPFCEARTLKETQGSTLTEFGCFDGRSYCYEGELQGWFCTACKQDFFVEPTLEEIHTNCVCRRGDCPDCGPRPGGV